VARFSRILLGDALLVTGGATVAWLSATSPERSGEAQRAAVAAITDRALAEMRRHYPEGAQTLVRRDAHAKAHGCARARFTVASDLPGELRVGSFADPGREYPAWTRFSNGSFTPGGDTGLDGRGMALKIFDARPDGQTHDILLINHPTFFSPDAVDYRDFADAGALTGDKNGLRRYFLPGPNPFNWRLRQGLIAYRIASAPILSPLSISYFSMAPFAFGPNQAIKYLARPCSDNPRPSNAERGPDFLRRELSRGLAGGEACFDLMVQMRKDSMPLEDLTVEWSEEESPFRPVGRITLMPQVIETPARDAFCEGTAFNPWNAPETHAPLGSMNEVRRLVYDKISAFRRQRNGVPAIDARSAWGNL
jgi:catalase